MQIVFSTEVGPGLPLAAYLARNLNQFIFMTTQYQKTPAG
jgi:hypothetical protein